MAWPSGGISTADLDAGSDSVASARAALYLAVQAVNDIAASLGVPSGAASLDSGGKLPSAQLPTGIIPAGVMLPYGGSTAPTGFLLCYGQPVSRSTYSDLFSAIGTTYGAGDGSTTFNLPDARGRVLAGKDDMGGTAAGVLNVTLSGTTTAGSAVITGLSSTAGLAVGMSAIGANIPSGRTIASIDSATQVTLSSGTSVTAGTASIRFGVIDGATLGAAGGGQVHTLTTPQIPAHTHNFDASGNAYYMLRSSGSGTFGWTSGALPFTSTSTGVQSAGGGQAHPNVQPTLITNTIIKT